MPNKTGTSWKVYAAVCDVSPSEQLTGDDDALLHLAIVMGLHSRSSFDQVGDAYHDEKHCLALRKWSGSRPPYRHKFVTAATAWKQNSHVMFGREVIDQRTVRRVGAVFFQQHLGPFGDPSSYSKKGKPRVRIGGRSDAGLPVLSYEVLIDDLCVIGWYGNALTELHRLLVETNHEPAGHEQPEIRLEILIDNLPNEKGGEDNYKANLLRSLVLKATNGGAEIIGVPENSDTKNRDLLVDNLAGLVRELESGTFTGDQATANALFSFSRRNSGLGNSQQPPPGARTAGRRTT